MERQACRRAPGLSWTARDSMSINRYYQTLRKMQPGTMGGQSRVATPLSDNPLRAAGELTAGDAAATVVPTEPLGCPSLYTISLTNPFDSNYYAQGSNDPQLTEDGRYLSMYSLGVESWAFPTSAHQPFTDFTFTEYDISSLGDDGGAALSNSASWVYVDGFIYAAIFSDNGPTIMLYLLKIRLDGTDPEFLWTEGIDPIDTNTEILMAWHPLDPDYIYMVYGNSTEVFNNLVKIHRTTGDYILVSDLVASDHGEFNDNWGIQQYDRGLVFLTAVDFDASAEMNIVAYDIVSDNVSHVEDPELFVFDGWGVRSDGVVIFYSEGVSETFAYQIDAGPIFTSITPPCDDPFYITVPAEWDGRETPSFWLATPDRSRRWVGDGNFLFEWE